MQEIIDIVLVMAIAVIALVAALLIPSKAEVQRSQTAKFKSGKPFIYAAGVLTIVVGILILLLFIMDDKYQDILNVPKMLFLMITGIALISQNVRMSKFMAACESGAVPMVAQPLEGEPVVAEAMPVAQPQAGTQPVVATTTPTVQPQPQVAPQQIGIKATPTVQAQPQVVAQPQPVQPASKILTIKCPKCQGAMQIDTGMLGQKIKCPHCGVEGKIG